MAESGIDGNLPPWPGAGACYSKAYRLLEKWALKNGKHETYDYEKELMDALNIGDEEKIKGILLNNISTIYEKPGLKTPKGVKWVKIK